jgi:hypothetical protein
MNLEMWKKFLYYAIILLLIPQAEYAVGPGEASVYIV